MAAVEEAFFRVMASDTQIILADPFPGAAESAERRLRQLESHWSRFLPASDISRINRASGQWVTVDPDTLTLIEAMKRAAAATSGAYDPTLLHEVIDAGYSASVDDPLRSVKTTDLPCSDHGIDDVITDRRLGNVWTPPGLALDPGGMGKGLAADIVVEELLAAGAGGALVSIGGDLAADGVAPSPAGWHVGIEDPDDPTTIISTVAFDRGGVATSSTRSRRWCVDGVERHHVIDPTLRRSSTTDLAAVTVFAPSGWQAEAHATAALLNGSARLVSDLDLLGLTALAITTDGRHLGTGQLRSVSILEVI